MPASESFVATELPGHSHPSTWHIASALAEVLTRHNHQRGERLSKMGISLSVIERDEQTGAPVASYRRVDIESGEDVARCLQTKALSRLEPLEILHPRLPFRLLSPLAPLLSDTFLFTNFGEIALPGVKSFWPFPVARGRSGVAFGAVTLNEEKLVLTLRARYLDATDAEAVLGEVKDTLAQHSRASREARGGR